MIGGFHRCCIQFMNFDNAVGNDIANDVLRRFPMIISSGCARLLPPPSSLRRFCFIYPRRLDEVFRCVLASL